MFLSYTNRKRKRKFFPLQLFSERDTPYPQQVEHLIEELFLQAMAHAVFYRLPQRASTCPQLRS
jgi:hypothetical protein